ncbi:MAG: lytic murein transglycosylase [Betaproteobacteria bacterium HGW-Betaproteobacteria-22]|nr:MAG: lytic murein transglycosylase [Betaproteobacteria bacterium HGW-Betaproteobacteria-22]
MRQLLSYGLIFIASILARPAAAQDAFALWLADLRHEARQQGISDQVADVVVNQIAFLPNTIKLDRAQPEFVSPFIEYYLKRVDAKKIQKGRALLQTHSALFDAIEAQYGVSKYTLVAFWGMETQYGAYQGKIDVLSTLATLAFEGRRADFFRSQLLDAMRMVDLGHVSIDRFKGSWAGAFGNMQFMPTTFMFYAVDGDGDGRVDVAGSLADAFASAANYLARVGWHAKQPVMLEVELPPDFDWQSAQLTLRKSTLDWAQSGVKAAVGGSDASGAGKGVQFLAGLPETDSEAAIILPQGALGPAFMVFGNFDVILDWNRSVNYALSVAQLAKRLKGEPRLVGGKHAEQGALTYQQMLHLQHALNTLGFDAGIPDGLPGLKTQSAVRAYQRSRHLPADGYASPSLYESLLPQVMELVGAELSY